MRTEIKLIRTEDRLVFYRNGIGTPFSVVMLLGALFGEGMSGMKEGETLTINVEKQ